MNLDWGQGPIIFRCMLYSSWVLKEEIRNVGNKKNSEIVKELKTLGTGGIMLGKL